MSLETNQEFKAQLQSPIPGLDIGSFLKFAIDPSQTQSVFDIQTSMLKAPNRLEMVGAALTSIANSESFNELYKKRYLPELPKSEELLKYSQGSLGRVVGEHLVANNIQLDFAGINLDMIYLKELTPMSFLGMRGLRIHDILHVLLGLGVTPIEEYAHASFTLAQYRSPFHMMVVSTGYLHTAFYEPREISRFLDFTHRYYELGTKASFVVGYEFENNFSKPLTEVRKELGLPENLPISI